MFHVAITLIMHLVPFGEPILGENICQNFIKISIPPSASCKMSKTSTQNLGNCFQSCMVYNGSSNMISRNAYTTECLCCQDVPSEDVFSSGNWISYSFACPVGYTEVTSHTTRACLRFVNSSVNYTLAASDCQQQGGDLIKIDTGRIGLIFIDFLFNYTTADERVDDSVWIQGQKDVNGIWRFHDGSKMPSFFQYYMVESNFIGEDRLRYRIPMGKFLDRQPTFPHSYMCEYRSVFLVILKEEGMSCEVKKGKGLFLKSYKDCRMHCREYHQEFVSLFRCPVAGCLYSCARRGHFPVTGTLDTNSTVDPLPVLVANTNYRQPGDRLKPHCSGDPSKMHILEGGSLEEKVSGQTPPQRKAGADLSSVKGPRGSTTGRGSYHHHGKIVGKV